MDKQTLIEGFDQLDTLAREEYHQSLQDVTSDRDRERMAVRIGRLVGVMLKAPFAEPEPLGEPSERTNAYRAWHLVDAEEFDKPEKKATWQYRTLEEINRELDSGSHYFEPWSVYELAQHAHHEQGFLGYLLRVLWKYICNDPEIRQKVEDAIKGATKGNLNIPLGTPESMVGAGGLALGAYLVQTIPILGFVGAPAIAAIVLILYTLGTTAFCKWSADLRTDEAEK